MRALQRPSLLVAEFHCKEQNVCGRLCIACESHEPSFIYIFYSAVQI